MMRGIPDFVKGAVFTTVLILLALAFASHEAPQEQKQNRGGYGDVVGPARETGAPEQESQADASKRTVENKGAINALVDWATDLKASDCLLVLFTAVLAWKTWGLDDSTRRLWDAGEKQLEFLRGSGERQLRAYLATVKHDLTPSKDGIIVTIRNCGLTPARHVSCRNNWYWHPPGGSLPQDFIFPDYPSEQIATNGYWGPGQELPVTFTVDPEKLEAVKQGRLVLYAYGHIDYVDWFGGSRTLRYCYQGFRIAPDRGGFRVFEAHNDGT